MVSDQECQNGARGGFVNLIPPIAALGTIMAIFGAVMVGGAYGGYGRRLLVAGLVITGGAMLVAYVFDRRATDD